MNKKYIYIYNKFINYTRNKDLYKSLNREDNFSDRLTLFLLHFSFFLKNYKNEENKKILQEIYDFNFRQLELSIREIGYGDQSINKKMKEYINLFHSMVSEIHFWDELSKSDKLKKISIFLSDFKNNEEYSKDFIEVWIHNSLIDVCDLFKTFTIYSDEYEDIYLEVEYLEYRFLSELNPDWDKDKYLVEIIDLDEFVSNSLNFN